VAPTTTTVYTVTATTSCGSATDSVIVRADSGGIRDDFEFGSASWTATGLWHLANNSTCAAPSPGFASPTHAFYYGRDATCSYDSPGVANTGTLTSAPIAGITTTSVLSFKHFRQVEFYDAFFDQTSVEVIRSNGTSSLVFNLNSRTPSTPGWVSSGNIPLGQFAGDTIRIRFGFNTGDANFNNFRGWFIDDVVVTASAACAPR
jgi:hypothetical protein